MKDKKRPFYQILGEVDKLPFFGFNNRAYFTSGKESVEKYMKITQKTLEDYLNIFFH